MSASDGILARLEQQLGPLARSPLPLDGGITNRNYRARFGSADCVIRLCGKATAELGIDRDTEEAAARRAAELGLAPPVLARLADEEVLVCEFAQGLQLAEGDLRRPAVLREAARMIRAFHASGPLPTAFGVFDLVARHATLEGARTPRDGCQFIALGRRIEAAVSGHPEHRPVPCHNDLLSANFLRSEGGLVLLDWEYAGMNDPFFDLGNLVVNNGLSGDDAELVLQAYFDEPPGDRRRAALALFELVSDMREAFWGVAQGVLSELDFDFDAYADEHFARLRSAIDRHDIEELLAVAGAA